MSLIEIIAIPLIAALIGWFTNYVAVKMLFRPYKKIKFGPLEIQGIFPKRQQIMAEKIGKLVSEEFLSINDIKETITPQGDLSMINKKIEIRIDEYLSTTFPANYPFMSFFVRTNTKSKLKTDFLFQVDQLAPQIVEQYISDMEGKLNVANIVQERISLLSPVDLEKLLLKILSKEFRFIELVGAVLGFIMGLIQVGLMFI